MPETRPHSAYIPATSSPLRNGNGNGHVNGNGSSSANGNGHLNGNGNGPHRNGHANGNTNGNGDNGSPPPLYTARAAPSTPRRSQPTKILGKIDEDGGMSPDIPIKSPKRSRKASSPPAYDLRAHLASIFPIRPPKNALDNVQGPRGEKFSDVRQNKKAMKSNRNMKKWLMCFGLVFLIIAAIIAIGVVIGLKRTLQGNSNDDRNGTSSNNNTDQLTGFPVGVYTFTTYLLSQTSSCTPNSATWRCYPYVFYNTSQQQSLSSLVWTISGTNTNTGPKYTISSDNNPFFLPFSDADLTLMDRRTNDEHWVFSTVIPKTVYPETALTADGSAATCSYNESMISGKLYTKKLTTLPGNVPQSGSQKPHANWPYASEMLQTAANPPVCHKLVNGANGELVTLDGKESGSGCVCDYADFEGSDGS